MAAKNLAAAVFGPDNIVDVMILKNRIAADLAASGVFHRAESSVVIINRGHRFQYLCWQWPPSSRELGRTQNPAAKGDRKTFLRRRAFAVFP